MKVQRSQNTVKAKPPQRNRVQLAPTPPPRESDRPTTDRTELTALSNETRPRASGEVSTPPRKPTPAEPRNRESLQDSAQLLVALQGLSQREKTEILTDFSTKLQTQKGTSENQKEKILAAVVMNRAMRELRKGNPTGSKAEILARSAGNPELEKWTNLADRSARVLKGVKRSSPPDPLQQAKQLGEAKAKSERIAQIYSDLNDSVREMAKKRLEILRSTHQEIAELFRTDRTAAQAQFASHSSEFLRITFGTLNKKGQYEF